MSNKEKVRDEMKKCRALQASWKERADKRRGERLDEEYAMAVSRSAIYGTMADHLEQILNEWG